MADQEADPRAAESQLRLASLLKGPVSLSCTLKNSQAPSELSQDLDSTPLTKPQVAHCSRWQTPQHAPCLLPHASCSHIHPLGRSEPRTQTRRPRPPHPCMQSSPAQTNPCSRFPACHARRVPLDQGENLSARQGSPQDPPRHPPTSHSQPRHLDKTAKPIVSRYIPCLHGLAHGQSSPQENTLFLRVFLSPFSLILVAMG
jgi:hypothetical protein